MAGYARYTLVLRPFCPFRTRVDGPGMIICHRQALRGGPRAACSDRFCQKV